MKIAFVALLAVTTSAFCPRSLHRRPNALLFSGDAEGPFGTPSEPTDAAAETSTPESTLGGPLNHESDFAAEMDTYEASIETTKDVPSGSVESIVMPLLQLAASTGRGEFATKRQKDQAETYIQAMESLNPTPEPANSPLANGRWELLYSSTQLFRSSPFFMAGRAVCSTPDQAKQYDWFCDMHRKALAISSIGQVRQIISPTKMVSEFEVVVGSVPFLSDFTPFSYSGGWPVTIEGAIVSSADISPNPTGDAWEIYMDTVEVKGSNIPGLRQVLDSGLMLGSRQLGNFLESNVDGYTTPRPVFEITYLSETIRICREQDGKVFVYGKLSDETAPSDYSTVDADLGLIKLLEGFNDSILKFYI